MTPRLTPVDILNKRFSRRVSGYNPAETEEFLRRIAADMETILLENASQREQVASLDRELSRYRLLENTMRDALILGQKAADEIREAARAQAAAQMEAAAQRVDALQEQTERLRLDRRRMAHEMRALLESQMAWLDYELARDTPQTAVAVEAEESALFPAVAVNEIKPVLRVSSAEFAALTELKADCEDETRDKAVWRSGASEAVPSENA